MELAKLFNFGILSVYERSDLKLFLDEVFFTLQSITIDHETGVGNYLYEIQSVRFFFLFLHSSANKMERTELFSLGKARFSHVFRGGGGFIVHCRVNRRSRSCLGPKSLAISTSSLPREPGQPSTSCQISLISKVFPLPISLVSSTFLNPPLTLREFIIHPSSSSFPQRNFQREKYETKEKSSLLSTRI